MLIITNFKTYETALGENALKLAKMHEEIKEEGVTFCVAPSIIDIEKVCDKCPNLTVFAQHVDAAGFGSFTGKVPPELIKKIGATGTILNHSEYRLNELEAAVKKSKEFGLKVIICAETVDEGVELAKLNPDFIAIEPPELIGGNVSVSTANPEIIRDAVKRIGKGKVIIGAGIKNAEDVRIAKKLGASGVLLASGITKASDPKKVLRDLADGAK